MTNQRRLTPNDHMLIAVSVNGIIAEAGRQAFVWQCKYNQHIDYAPPLFRLPGVELPVVPRIAPLRIEAWRRGERR